MKPPFKSLAELDRTIHDPSRLAILTALSSLPQCRLSLLTTVDRSI
jgi:hypothetical protein